MRPNGKDVIVSGAGPVGSLLSVVLAKRGYPVRMLEKRADMRLTGSNEGRSINLAISVRGLAALRKIGIEEEVLASAVSMRGRLMHAVSGALTYQAYGKDESECIYSISRGGLNRSLMETAEKHHGVRIDFNTRVTGFRMEGERVNLQIFEEAKGRSSEVHCDTLFGADGAGSAVREAMLRRTGAAFRQEFLDYGYKELTIPSGQAKAAQLERNALHIWPRGSFMLIALPNFDGSYTCTLFLPYEGPNSFKTLTGPREVERFFHEQFPDVTPLIPDLAEAYAAHPTGSMVTIRCASWNLGERALLIGDAAHAIVPFFGQGMNCGFEDCSILDELLDKTDLPSAIRNFSNIRMRDTDAIAQMAVENFIEMRDKVGNAAFLIKKEAEKILQKTFPREYLSRYSLVTFSRIPYHVAAEAGEVEDAILTELCDGLAHPEDVDLDRAAGLIRERLNPVLQVHLKSGH